MDHKLTVKELAKKLGYSAPAVGNWEKGKTVPNQYALEDLSSYMGITVEELTKGVDSR